MKTKFTVERATWYRGHGPSSRLLRKEDRMRCCLGHVGKQCGVSDISMEGIGTPANLPLCERALFPAAFLNSHYNNSFFTDQCITTNDNPRIGDEEREKTLIELFKDKDLELEFV